MIKTIGLPDVLVPKVQSSDSKIIKFDISGDKKLAKKLRKLSKPQKLSKLKKQPLKNSNLPKFDPKKAGPNILNLQC